MPSACAVLATEESGYNTRTNGILFNTLNVSVVTEL